MAVVVTRNAIVDYRMPFSLETSPPPMQFARRLSPLPAMLLAALLALTLSAAASPRRTTHETAPVRQKLKQSAEELERVRAKLDAASKTLEHDRSTQDEERAAVEAAERKIAENQQALRKTAAAVAQQQVRVRDAEAAKAIAQTRLDAQRELLARQLRAAYIVGQTGEAELMLGDEPGDRKDRMLSYYDYLNRASADQIAALDREIAAVQERQERVDAELKVLRDAEVTRKRTLAAIEAERAARSQAIAKLDQRIAGKTEEIKQLQGSEAQIESLLTRLKSALAAEPVRPRGAQKGFPEMRGHHPWPLRGNILANYGDPKADSRLQWKGLWIGAPEGAEVRASAHGRVAYVGWLSSYGLIVVLEHENGYFTLYGHNASVAKLAGEEVDSDEVIAFAGNTGGYEQTGLYFEVRKGTDPLNPRDWLGR
jgi:septal ring factor EnvC (AmiA/AmiB activator)